MTYTSTKLEKLKSIFAFHFCDVKRKTVINELIAVFRIQFAYKANSLYSEIRD